MLLSCFASIEFAHAKLAFKVKWNPLFALNMSRDGGLSRARHHQIRQSSRISLHLRQRQHLYHRYHKCSRPPNPLHPLPDHPSLHANHNHINCSRRPSLIALNERHHSPLYLPHKRNKRLSPKPNQCPRLPMSFSHSTSTRAPGRHQILRRPHRLRKRMSSRTYFRYSQAQPRRCTHRLPSANSRRRSRPGASLRVHLPSSRRIHIQPVWWETQEWACGVRALDGMRRRQSLRSRTYGALR